MCTVYIGISIFRYSSRFTFADDGRVVSTPSMSLGWHFVKNTKIRMTLLDCCKLFCCFFSDIWTIGIWASHQTWDFSTSSSDLVILRPGHFDGIQADKRRLAVAARSFQVTRGLGAGWALGGLMGVQTVNSEGLPVTGTSTMNDNEDVFPIGKGWISS